MAWQIQQSVAYRIKVGNYVSETTRIVRFTPVSATLTLLTAIGTGDALYTVLLCGTTVNLKSAPLLIIRVPKYASSSLNSAVFHLLGS